MKKSNQRETSKLWLLERNLGIPIWHNYLSIPTSNSDYQASEISLQEELNFVFTRDSTLTCKVFVSELTNFLSLFQCIPFLCHQYSLYLCNDQLISERLSFLNQKSSLTLDNSATKQLNELLEIAAAKSASDIHLESETNRKTLRMRINGILENQLLRTEINEKLFSKIKLISGLDIAKTRSPQDGHFPYTTAQGKRYDMRVSTLPAIFGEKIVIRLLAASTVHFSMEELGFSKEHIPLIKKCVAKKSGMILFTGPTGSGKTTSLYTILKSMNSGSQNIVTVEDPVEYRINHITQVEVNESAGSSFSSLLRALLRQDPDVILVGEIRDKETASIAARAAQTGHLVLSTLHSNDAFETIRRLQNLGVENDDIASSLKMVISQRLVQKRCQCQNDPQCQICFGTGTDGRIPIMEVLHITPKLGYLISKGSSINELRTHAEMYKHKSLQMIGEGLINAGLITGKELDSVVSF